ncbi:creatininase family protein [Zeaxanthinibacter sp. PT1]|uniref:creatininase family protein n=1 Tax=Zeaxanthinibacter TaxID=561554 RepID=UPI00234ABD5D|nr:creatininase family protein [Zeaxanthinibacter sp. PT1]MDC6351806.1 creatininase family protein [Zeaxanthinibacter sp. PT1]
MEPRPYVLAETNYKLLKDQKIELAVLPWGATEAHNYHLPYGTDNYQAEAIAAEAAKIAWSEGGKVMVLPAVPFGVNTGQHDIYLDINLNPSTQLAILKDVAATLKRQGIPKLLIFNGHGGNNFKPLVRELGLEFPELFICYADSFRALDKTLYFDNEGDHADEMETSLMLYLQGGLVLPKEEWGSGAHRQFRISSFSEGWAWAERKWSAVSEDTGIGDPSMATEEKGERYFKDISEKMGAFMLELCQADPKDMYTGK